jgi:uracil-DNA glycosylase family 4
VLLVFEVRPMVVTASTPMLPRRVRVPLRPPAAAGATLGAMPSAEQRRDELKAVYGEASVCTRCPQLAATRQTVVFGSGNADADLMFVGEAPGANEDKQGVPFVGQAGKLLDQLLGEIGFARSDVFIANVLKCLRYNVPVQLGDGSWERVGRLVRSRYSGTVMSVDEAGRLVPRRVIGWHATPVGDRTVHRLTYRSAKRSGVGRLGIELTGDHPVLTERGYVRADELKPDDRMATGQGLSALARDVTLGTLLGDGSISGRRAALTFGHSARQSEYARFKAALLQELQPVAEERQVAAVAGGARVYDVIHVRTRAHRALGTLRSEFYRPRKVVPSWLATELNPRMLAFWFMDDGYMRVRPPRQPSAEIATVCFSDADLQVLLEGLKRLGLPAKASRRRIFFDVGVSRELSRCIAPFVPPSMRYKLHPEIEREVPFEAGRFERGAQEVLFDEIDIEDVTDTPRPDRTFFCIDVEDTHNFVTSGGVVHNCRPPGNRDPLPQEIDNCQDYLFRQLDLIQPKVVCTLGNFSTKLLRADPATGITKLHGREEVRVIGPRAVRLYPIYHPAAALYTRSLLDTLRADFARLPDLLALDPPPQPELPAPVVPEPELVEEIEEIEAAAPDPAESQLGLF